MTTITKALLKELDQEAQTTRKFLTRLPEDKYQWQPHPKSMTLTQLATHIAEIPTWVEMVLNTEELDFNANEYKPTIINDNKHMLELFEEALAKAKAALEKATDADLLPNWTMRSGDHIIMVSSKGEMIRTCYSQIVHHRAQLGVFFRLLDVPVPGSYGPTADEPSF